MRPQQMSVLLRMADKLTCASFLSGGILVDQKTRTELPPSWLLDSINRAWMMHVMRRRHFDGQSVDYKDVKRVHTEENDFDVFDGSALMAFAVLVEEFTNEHGEHGQDAEDEEDADSDLDSFGEVDDDSDLDSVGEADGKDKDNDNHSHYSTDTEDSNVNSLRNKRTKSHSTDSNDSEADSDDTTSSDRPGNF